MRFQMKQPIVMILLFAFLMLASVYQAVTTQTWWLLGAVAVLVLIFVLLVVRSSYYVDEDFITSSTLARKTIVSTEDVQTIVRRMSGKRSNSYRIFLLDHNNRAVMAIDAVHCQQIFEKLQQVCPHARATAE